MILGSGCAKTRLADVGLGPIKTKAVQIWESCAHEAHAGPGRSGRNRHAWVRAGAVSGACREPGTEDDAGREGGRAAALGAAALLAAGVLIHWIFVALMGAMLLPASTIRHLCE